MAKPKSGNPAKRAEELRISQVGDFKKRTGGIMQLPSGAVVKLKNPGGLRAFIDSGTIPNSLMVIIQKSLDTGKKPKTKDLMSKEGNIDPEMLEDMMSMMDSVAMKCIVEPPVLPIPEDEDDRDDELLYIDELPQEDKMFIFQWVSGGVKDLETFRKQSLAGVDDLAAESSGEAVALSSVGTDGR